MPKILQFIKNKVKWLGNESETFKIVYLYRYISLVITSLFYFIDISKHTLAVKAFIILCIVVSSIILNTLYLKNQGNSAKVILLVYMEIILNCFILIPSGGLSSPYVWYALNTLLITSMMFRKIFCWLNLLVYLSVATASSWLIVNKANTNLTVLIHQNMNFVLGFTLITLAIQLLTRYLKRMTRESEKLKLMNECLYDANTKIRESMNYILELYQAVHLFTTMDDRDELVRQIVKYTAKITRVHHAFFYSHSGDGGRFIGNPDQADGFPNETERKALAQQLELAGLTEGIKTAELFNKAYILVPIHSSFKRYGLLAVETDKTVHRATEVKEQLEFLSELGAIVLERFELEEVNEKLLVTQEQNRIADEIHDSVLQRLFSVSCGIFKLTRGSSRLSQAQIRDELEVMQRSLSNAMGELRAAVYGMSWKKRGMNSFLLDINSYIQETRDLNHIAITCDLTGDDTLLTLNEKRAIYRIICEAVGNAVHHGKADQIGVALKMSKPETLLEITDNGIGFDPEKVIQLNKGGLGIQNICQLVQSMNGKITFTSQADKGTGIFISIPDQSPQTRKDVAV